MHCSLAKVIVMLHKIIGELPHGNWLLGLVVEWQQRVNYRGAIRRRKRPVEEMITACASPMVLAAL